MILLACAVAKELEFWSDRPNVTRLITGVGPVEAAASVAHALAQQRYRLVINAGIAGAFEGAASIGDGVCVASERFEVDIENGEPIRLPDGNATIERADSEPELVAHLGRHGVPSLAGITVSRVTATEATARRLAALGAQVESMEGFAVLRVAAIHGVPAVEIRGISNRAGERSRSGWNFSAGVAGLQAVMHTLFLALDHSHV
jgi:futalosine hydrolase